VAPDPARTISPVSPRGGGAGPAAITTDTAEAGGTSVTVTTHQVPRSFPTVRSRRGFLAPQDAFSRADLQYFPAACDAVPGMERDGSVAEEVYYLGIIDILQQYNLRKVGESWMKSLRYKRADISAVDPALYAQRFVAFLEEHSV
jgi:hypothetical protein